MTKIQMTVDDAVIASCSIPDEAVVSITQQAKSIGQTPAAVMLNWLNRAISDAMRAYPPAKVVELDAVIQAAQAEKDALVQSMLAQEDSELKG